LVLICHYFFLSCKRGRAQCGRKTKVLLYFTTPRHRAQPRSKYVSRRSRFTRKERKTSTSIQLSYVYTKSLRIRNRVRSSATNTLPPQHLLHPIPFLSKLPSSSLLKSPLLLLLLLLSSTPHYSIPTTPPSAANTTPLPLQPSSTPPETPP
jgi:hypothetical protein